MLQSKSSATGLTSNTTVAVFPDQRTVFPDQRTVVDTMVTKITPTYKRKYYDFRKEVVCDGRLVGIVESFGIHAQCISVKFAEVWRNRLLTTDSPSLIEIGNMIIEYKDIIEVVNDGPVTYRLTMLDSQNKGYRNIVHLIFTPAYFVIEIPKYGHIFVTGSGKGPAINAMMEKNMVLGEDLSFHKAFLLGCEGMEGAQKENIHTDGFRRAFTVDGTFMENFWMEGDDFQE